MDALGLTARKHTAADPNLALPSDQRFLTRFWPHPEVVLGFAAVHPLAPLARCLR